MCDGYLMDHILGESQGELDDRGVEEGGGFRSSHSPLFILFPLSLPCVVSGRGICLARANYQLVSVHIAACLALVRAVHPVHRPSLSVRLPVYQLLGCTKPAAGD